MDTIETIFTTTMNLLGSVRTLLIGLATVVFFWGIVRYFRKQDSAEARSESASFMVYGLISLFVIFGIWGLVYMLGNTFDLKIGQEANQSQNQTVPGSGVPGPSGSSGYTGPVTVPKSNNSSSSFQVNIAETGEAVLQIAEDQSKNIQSN